MHPKELVHILRPQTELEARLLSTPEFQVGMAWGEPRFGHPEGAVAYHVREVLENIELIEGTSKEEREKLRLVAFVHDTFKYVEARIKPRTWASHHAILAKRFLESFTKDAEVLSIVELHDEAYYCWRKVNLPHFAPASRYDLEGLLQRVGPFLQLYYLFFKSDTQTGDKNQAPLFWFEKKVLDIEITPIREQKRTNRHGAISGI